MKDMNECKIKEGQRLLVSNRWSQIRLGEVSVLEIAESGQRVKLRNLITNKKYWSEIQDFHVVEQLPPLPLIPSAMAEATRFEISHGIARAL